MPEPIDPLIPQEQPAGLFNSFLDWAGRAAQPGLNLLAGNPEGALRQTADWLGDIPDAVLPGHWIPHISRPEDFVSPHQILGTDVVKHPTLAKLEDVFGNVAANPLSWNPVGHAAIKLSGEAATKAVSLLPDAVQDGIAGAGRMTRQVFAAEDMAAKTSDIRRKAIATGENVRRAQVQFAAGLAKGRSADDGKALGRVMLGVWRDGDGVHTLEGGPDDRLAQYAELHPDADIPWLSEAMGKVKAFNDQQFKEGSSTGYGGGIFNPGYQNQSYFPRIFSGSKMKDTMEEDEFGNYRPTRARISGAKDVSSGEVTSPEEELPWSDPKAVGAFLAKHPDINLEDNAFTALGQRAEKSGGLATRASVLQQMTEHDVPEADAGGANLQNPKAVQRVADMIDQAKADSPEDAQILADLFNGLPPREGILKYLNKANGVFKKFAVYGAIIPKIGTVVSNMMSVGYQQAATAATRGHALTSVKDIIPTLVGASSDAIGGIAGDESGFKDFLGKVDQATSSIFGNKVITPDIQRMEDAFKNSGGSLDAALNGVYDPATGEGSKIAREALENGVLNNGFVSSERLIDQANHAPWRQFVQRWWDMPGVLFQGTEQRMRLSLFKAMREQEGMEAPDAARATNEAMHDYNASSIPSRNARDLIPFWQFSAKSIPQTLKLIAEAPSVGIALNQLNSQGNGQPIMPYMQGNTNIPIGENEAGDNEFITGFRLPYESLSMIPNPSASPLQFGEEIRHSLISSSSPLLKSAWGVVSGRDPYFDSRFGSYDKIPALGDSLGSDTGRAYNDLAGAGLIQPLDTPLRMVGDAINPDRSAPIRALRLLTGIHIADVNPVQARQAQIQEELDTSPNVQTGESPYSKSRDPDTMAMIKQLNDAKSELHKQKVQAAAKAAVDSGEHSPELDPKDLAQAVDQTQALGHTPEPLPASTPVQQSQHIPLGGGVAADNSVIYLDPSIPDSLDVKTQDHSGTVTIDPRPRVANHEATEKPLIDAGLPYEPAHAIATLSEEDGILADGLDPVDYQRKLMAHVKKSKKKNDGTVPANLDPTPYVDSGEADLLIPPYLSR